MRIYDFDATIVGAGLAGMRAVVELEKNGFRVALISLVPQRQSHSNAAQGGIQASLRNIQEGLEDNWEAHFKDTIKGSDWGADQNIAELVCRIAPRLIREMEYWGACFSRTKEGKISQRQFGGTTYPRCAYASDGTGHILLNTLDSKAMSLDVPMFTRRQMISLIHNGEKISGVTALNIKTGELEAFNSPVVILATGGAGQLFRETTNAKICWGDGMAAAINTGIIPLGNPEAIQFHPTPLVPTSILVTEGCRGDGGVLLDKDEYAFMGDYTIKKDLASRDVVSRSMMRHIKKGFGIDSPYGPHLWLDIKRLGIEHVTTKLADVNFLCKNFVGIDPTKEYIPVRPAHHYTMFGVKTNEHCEVYGPKGLYAVGECACWDLHGFNRLGGNSLLETLAAGYISGINATEYLKTKPRTNSFEPGRQFATDWKMINDLISNESGEYVLPLYKQMKNTLSDAAGIFRNKKDLENGLNTLVDLYGRSNKLKLKSRMTRPGPNKEIQLALRLPGMLKIALCIVNAALLREESRGSHYREDFPERNDAAWLKRTLAYFSNDATLPNIGYESIDIDRLPPGDRGYAEDKGGPK